MYQKVLVPLSLSGHPLNIIHSRLKISCNTEISPAFLHTTPRHSICLLSLDKETILNILMHSIHHEKGLKFIIGISRDISKNIGNITRQNLITCWTTERLIYTLKFAEGEGKGGRKKGRKNRGRGGRKKWSGKEERREEKEGWKGDKGRKCKLYFLYVLPSIQSAQMGSKPMGP